MYEAMKIITCPYCFHSIYLVVAVESEVSHHIAVCGNCHNQIAIEVRRTGPNAVKIFYQKKEAEEAGT